MNKKDLHGMSVRIRSLTETNLGRITKGSETNGFAIIKIPNCEDLDDHKTLIKDFKISLTHNGCSYIIIYGGVLSQGRLLESMDAFFVVFPHSITKRAVMDFRSFEKVTDDLLAAQAPGVSVLARIDPVSPQRSTDKETFLSQIRRLCLDAAGNSSPNYALYIDNPPTSMQIGHARWAAGNMNHIYKELERK